MLFDTDEKILLTEHKVPTGNGKETGDLILTNKRLALETTRTTSRLIFIKDKQDFVVFNIPLTSILVADKKKDIIRKGHKFRINANGKEMNFTVKEPQMWINHIAAAKTGQFGITQPSTFIDARTVNPAPTNIPAHGEATQVVEKEVIKIKCSICGGLADETESNCPNCGALL